MLLCSECFFHRKLWVFHPNRSQGISKVTLRPLGGDGLEGARHLVIEGDERKNAPLSGAETERDRRR